MCVTCVVDGAGRGRRGGKQGGRMEMEDVVEPRSSFFRFFEDYGDEADELDSEEQVRVCAGGWVLGAADDVLVLCRKWWRRWKATILNWRV